MRSFGNRDLVRRQPCLLKATVAPQRSEVSNAVSLILMIVGFATELFTIIIAGSCPAATLT